VKTSDIFGNERQPSFGLNPIVQILSVRRW
jgi:hypothetical protein